MSLIKKYTPQWVNDFILLKNELEKVLIGFKIEHMGSTSVPSLAAKPIIDIDIIYQNTAEFEKIKKGLSAIGYYHNGNQGIEFRDVFKRTKEQHHPILDCINHHLYVCLQNSEPLERHLLSRDFLRNNEWARLKYQEMKYALAEEALQDKKRYAALKELNVNDFIDEIIELQRNSNP